jgi:hypothetical protein
MLDRRLLLRGAAALPALLLPGPGAAVPDLRRWAAVGRRIEGTLGAETAARLLAESQGAARRAIGRFGFSAAVARDYRAGRTLTIEGFLLSRCEVAAALAAVSGQRIWLQR